MKATSSLAGKRGPVDVGQVLADEQIGRLLDAWTAPGNPTLDEARQSVGIENLDILGDKGLRYR